MTEADVAALLRDTMLVTLKLGAPPLLAALVVGLAISVLQAVTQINEATLAFVPKVLAIGATLALLGGFMLAVLADFTRLLMDRAAELGGRMSGVILSDLPRLAFGLVLVLARVGGMLMLLPGIGDAEVPAMPRAGLALAVSLLLLPLVLPAIPAEPESPAGIAVLVAAEAFTGALLGWLTRLAVLALGMAGQVAAYMLGLSSVLVPDPALGGQSTALERLCILAAILAMFGTGLHALPLRALAGSYRLLVPGTVPDAGDGADLLIAALAEAFALALRLAAPIVLLGTVFQLSLGLLSRLVPRLQVYFIAMPGQILGGLLLLALLSEPLLGAWHDAAATALSRLPGLD